MALDISTVNFTDPNTLARVATAQAGPIERQDRSTFADAPARSASAETGALDAPRSNGEGRPTGIFSLSTLQFAETTRFASGPDRAETVAPDPSRPGSDANIDPTNNLGNEITRLAEQRAAIIAGRTSYSTPPGEIPPDAPVPDMPSPAPDPLPDDPTTPQPEPGNPLPVQTPSDRALQARASAALATDRSDPTAASIGQGAAITQARTDAAAISAQAQAVTSATRQAISAAAGDDRDVFTAPQPTLNANLGLNPEPARFDIQNAFLNTATGRAASRAVNDALANAYRAAQVETPRSPLTDIIVGTDNRIEARGEVFGPEAGLPANLNGMGRTTGEEPADDALAAFATNQAGSATAGPTTARPTSDGDRTGPAPAGNPDATRVPVDASRPSGLQLRPAAGNLEPYMYYGFLTLTPPSAPAATAVTQAVAGELRPPVLPPPIRAVVAPVDVLNRSITQRFLTPMPDAMYNHDGVLGSPALQANVGTLLNDNPAFVDPAAFDRMLREGLIDERA